MATHNIGKVFVELDLDPSRYMRGQQTLRKEATEGAKILEKNFKNLGIKSGATFDLMRAQAEKSFEAIKKSGRATADDLIRAEKAKAAKITQINEEQYGKQISMFSKLKANWLATTVAMTAAYMAAQKAWNMAETATQYQQSITAFRTMVQSMGWDADVEFAKIREKSAGLIDKKSLVEAANKAMSLGIPIDKLGALMEIARAKARDMGISTAQAFSDIATGVGRASPLILDNLGLVMKVGSANEAMARSLGKTVEQLTDQEKKMAVLNATLEAGKEALNRYDLSVKTTKERMDELLAQKADLILLFGEVLIRGVAATGASFNYLAGGVLGLVSAYAKYRALVYKILGDEKQMKENLDIANDAYGARNELLEKSKGMMDLALASREELAKVGTKSTIMLKENTEALSANALSAKEVTEQVKALAKAIEDELADIPSGLYYDDEWNRIGQQIFNGYNTAFQNIEMSYEEMLLAIDAENEKLKKSTKESVDVVEELWIKGLNRVQKAFADTFYDAMTGELDSLSDVFRSFFDDILRMVAEFAAKMAMSGLFQIAGSIFGGGAGAVAGGAGAAGGSSFWSWLQAGGSAANTGYSLYSGKSIGQSIAESIWNYFGSAAAPADVAGEAAGGFSVASGGFGTGAYAFSGGAGAYGGLGGMGAGQGGAALGEGFAIGAGAAAGIAAAAMAAIFGLAAIAEHNLGDQDTKLHTRSRLRVSDDPNLALQGEMYKVMVSGGEYSAEDIKTSMGSIGNMIKDALDVYNSIFANLGDESKSAIKEALSKLPWDTMSLDVSMSADEGAPIWANINRTTANEISSHEWEELTRKAAAMTLGMDTFDPFKKMIAEAFESEETQKAIIDAIKKNGAITGQALADILGVNYDELSEKLKTAYGDGLKDLVDAVNAAYAGGIEGMGSATGGPSVWAALQSLLGDYFKDYVGEALENVKASEMFGFMMQDIQDAINSIDPDLFIEDVAKFGEMFTKNANKIYTATKVWESLNAFVGRASNEITAYDRAMQQAQYAVTGFVAKMKEWGVELTDEEIAAKAKDFLKKFLEGIDDTNMAVRPLSQLGQALAALNGQFDAYLELLEKNGVDLKKLTDLENMRTEATERLLNEYKKYLGLIDGNIDTISEIEERYKRFGLTNQQLINQFKNATLDELKMYAKLLGIDWTDIADDIGVLIKALGDAGDETKRIIDAQRRLLGTTDTGWIEDIEKRFGMAGGTITSDWFNKIMAKFTAMSADDVKRWADTLGISVDQLIAYIMGLADIFGVLGDSAGDATDKIKRAQSEMLGLTDRYEKELLERKYRLPEGTITEDYIRNIINKFTSMSAEEIEKWAKSLGVSVDDLIADIMRMIGIFDIVAMSIEDAAIKIKELFQGVNDFINRTSSTEKAAMMWSRLLKMADPFITQGKVPSPTDLANISERLSEWFYAAEAAARELGQAELEAARLQIQVADRVSALIDQVDETIRNIKYSPLSVSLPHEKAEEAQEDYDKLLSAALTGGPEDVSKYLGFASTYLQQQQNNLKSSQAYQDVYASVMADMETIKGIAEADSYDAKILEELQRGNELTVEQTEAYKTAMAEVIRKWELGTNWINDWLGKYEAADIAIKIKWEDYEGSMADALKMLSDLVAIYGWDHEYTLKFLADIPMRLFKDLDDLAKAAGWIADQSGGWNSKATIAFLKNVAENWKFDNINEILAAIGYVKTKAGSWTADATIAFIAKLMGRYNVPIEDIDYWLRQMGITDTEILREVKIRLIYSMWSSGDLSLAEIAKYVYNEALAAWLAKDAVVAIPIIRLLEGLASMWGVRNAYDLGAEVNKYYPAAADAAAWPDLWTYYGRAPQWAKGTVVDQPTLGWVGEAGYPEAVIPMMDGYSIPVKWVNGGSTQAGASKEELQLLREQNKLLSQLVTQGKAPMKIEGLGKYTKAVADNVVVSRNKRGKGNTSTRYYQ